MNPIGIGIIVFIAYYGYRGFQRGLVEEIGRLIGLVLAVLLANRFSSVLAGQLGLDSEVARTAAAFVIIFVITLVAMSFVIRVVRTLIELVLLEWLDRMGGILFGVLKSILVLGVLIYIMESVHFTQPFVTRLEQRSFVYRQVVALKNGLFSVLSLDSLIQDAHDHIKDLEPERLLPSIKDF
ncbi:MAG: CvpA family protein [Candidatus Marinimicrobia bacterium]|nr:CvpA family protein [Candidatus Neomarinimicrobiota bacterium]